MVCGYRGTGKDTLCRMMNREEPFEWAVYSDVQKTFDIIPVKRVGFADNLKSEVNTILGNEWDDSQKDRPIGGDQASKTYRDVLIDHAAKRRDEDPEYWVKSACNWETLDENIMITDWRYPNELKYLLGLNFLIRTIRVFRTEVPIPEEDVEHHLNAFMTEYLLVPSTDHKEEFRQAVVFFPQYKGHKLVNFVD